MAVFVTAAVSSCSRPSDLLRCTGSTTLHSPWIRTISSHGVGGLPGIRETARLSTSLGFQLQRVSSSWWPRPCTSSCRRARCGTPDPASTAHSTSAPSWRCNAAALGKALKSVLRYEKSARLAAAFLELPQRLRSRRRTLRGCYPRQVDPSHSSMIGKHRNRYCLDFFSGKGGVSKALHRLGFRGFEYDILHGAEPDLKAVLKGIRRAIFRGVVLSVMFGTPCTSFSVARDHTSVIRDRTYLWGNPERFLSAKDKEKVRLGNLCAQSTLRIIGWLQRFGIPWCVESPHSSKLWRLPPFQELLLQPTVKAIAVDFCQ